MDRPTQSLAGWKSFLKSTRSRRSSLRLACGVLLSVASWGAIACLQAADADSKPLNDCEWLPLGVGREWSYTSGPLLLVERVTRHEEFGGEFCARLETILGEKIVSFEHLAVRKDGIYRVGLNGKAIEPPLLFARLPLEAGAKWSVDSKIAGQNVKGDFSTREETIQIGNDSVPTMVVEGKNFKVGGSDLTFTYYFAKKVGKVKQSVAVNGEATVLELPSLQNATTALPARGSEL
jgi:hypothetical protein